MKGLKRNMGLAVVLLLTFALGVHTGRILSFFTTEPINPTVTGFSMLLSMVVLAALLRWLLSSTSASNPYAASASVMAGHKQDIERPELNVDPMCPKCLKPAVGIKNLMPMFNQKGVLNCQACGISLVVEDKGSGQGVLVPALVVSLGEGSDAAH